MDGTVSISLILVADLVRDNGPCWFWLDETKPRGPSSWTISRKDLSLTLAIEKRARAWSAAWRSSRRVQVRAASTALTWQRWRAKGKGRANQEGADHVQCPRAAARSPERRATLPSRIRIRFPQTGQAGPVQQPQGHLHGRLRVQALDQAQIGVVGGRGLAQGQPQPEPGPVVVREGGHRGHAVGRPRPGTRQRDQEQMRNIHAAIVELGLQADELDSEFSAFKDRVRSEFYNFRGKLNDLRSDLGKVGSMTDID